MCNRLLWGAWWRCNLQLCCPCQGQDSVLLVVQAPCDRITSNSRSVSLSSGYLLVWIWDAWNDHQKLLHGHAFVRSWLLLSLEPPWSAVEVLGAGVRFWWWYLIYQTWAMHPSSSLWWHAFFYLLSANSHLLFLPAPLCTVATFFPPVRSHLPACCSLPFAERQLVLAFPTSAHPALLCC